MLSNKYTFKLLISLFFILPSSLMYGQDFFILAKNDSLKNVLFQVKEKYNFQISSNAQLLKTCLVSSSKKYQNLDLLLEDLLSQCNLHFVKQNNIYIIKQNKKKPQIFHFNLKLIDGETKEALAYSNIQINNSHLVSDIDGNVNYVSNSNTIKLLLSHLAYSALDTSLNFSKNNHIVALKPMPIDLETVEVMSKKTPKRLTTGNRPGLIELNHILARQLPGSNNNSIFNVLRLQAGVLAAGEPSKDFIIRAAYKGQSHILFDGISIFNSSSFDDRISAFNPLMVKNVLVHKSGYQADIGDRVSGVVELISKDGSTEKNKYDVNISNQAIGGYANISLKKNMNLQLAIRNVFPDLFRANTYQKTTPFFNNLYSDINLKFVSKIKNNDLFKISILAQRNIYLEEENDENNLRKYNLERNTLQYQAGASALYLKQWKRAGSSKIIAAFSMLSTQLSNKVEYVEKLNVSNSDFEENDIENGVSEFSFKLEHKIPSSKIQDIKFGLGYIYNQTSYQQDSSNVFLKRTDNKLSRLSFFIKDNFSFTKYLNIIAGLKIDYVLGDNSLYFQPRIQAIIKPNRNWNINAAYGIYNQFLEEKTFLDRLNNRIYYWDIQSRKDNKRLGAMHYVLGLSADYNFLSFSAEAYYRNTYNFDYLSSSTQQNIIVSEEIKARTYGADFHIKTQYKRHILWVAYTISKSEEKVSKIGDYYLADQDQRHELKTALILNFRPFTLSTNYVFGSGFLDLGTYNRLDLALSYTKKMKKFKLELGASVLNLTNTKNIKYSNFSNFPNNKTIYSSALGITPNLFMNLSF